MKSKEVTIDDFELLYSLNIDEIPDLNDKISECEYFLTLALASRNVNQFRWLSSAFLSAARSFLEIHVQCALSAFGDEKGNRFPDQEALQRLEKYIRIKRDSGLNFRIRLKPVHPLLKQLFTMRNKNTHVAPLFINVAECGAESQFLFGFPGVDAVIAFDFLQEVMQVLRKVDELSSD